MPGPYATSSALNYIGFAKQSAKGTGAAPTVFLPYQGSVDLDHGMDADQVREGGTGPYVARSQKTKHDPSGGAGCAWRPTTLGKLVAWFLGSDVVSGVAAPFTHTATPLETTTYLSAEQNLADEATERFVDAVISKLTIEGEGNGDLMASIEWWALTPGWQGAPTVETYESGVSGVSPGGPFRQHEATYTVDGVGATNLESFSIELTWNFDDDLRQSKVTRAHAVKLELEGTVELTGVMLDVDDYRKTNYGSISGTAADRNFFGAGSFVAAYDNGLTTTNQRTVNINAPNVDWTEAKYTEMDPDGETVKLNRSGTIKKIAGTAFVTVASGTVDSTAY